MNDTSKLSRQALGRKASLGSFYDVRRDAILPNNIFLNEPRPSFVTETRNSHRDVTFFPSDELWDRFEGFGVESELALSVTAGLIKPAGAAEFLLEQKKRPKAIQFTLSHKISQFTETIDLDGEGLKEIVNAEAFCEEAPHVIVGIEYGTKTLVTVTQELSDQEGLDIWRERLDAFMKAFQQAIDKEDSKLMKFPLTRKELDALDFAVFSDHPGENFVSPRNVHEIIKLLQEMPGHSEMETSDTGCRIRFELMPVEELAKLVDASHTPEGSLKTISTKISKQIMEKVEEVNSVMTKLHDYKLLLNNLCDIVPNCMLDEFLQFESDCESEQNEWEEGLKKEIPSLRYTDNDKEVDEFEIQHLMRGLFKKSNLSKIAKYVENEELVQRKALLDRCREANILVTKEVYLRDIYAESGETKIFVFHFNYEGGQTSSFEVALAEFLTLARSYADCRFVAVYEGSHHQGSHAVQKDPRISITQSGELICEDYLKVLQVRSVGNVVMCQSPMLSGPKKPESMPLEIPCPCYVKDRTCSAKVHRWRCYHCLREMEYDFEGKIHCDCGYQMIDNYGFRCADPNHGQRFELFGAGLRPFLNNMAPMQELVILVIGETGVGKSTWINAIANYITHENWKEAREDKLLNLIPTSFSLSAPTKKGTIDIEVKVGEEDDNERNSLEGESATRHPKSYVFTHNYTSYRIIDTPGIGDTGGLDVDTKNIQEIQQYMAKFPEIHLICFLMLPDVGRITERFQFCLLQLIQQFHSSAAKNIVFCFTNASSTGFTVGQTNRFLKTFVKTIKEKQNVEIQINQDTEFIFDNMAYRYLCAIHQNVDRKVFAHLEGLYEQSFEHSRNETLRLLEHALTVKPHYSKETQALNLTRSVILKLTEPLARINHAVHKTLEDIEENRTELLMYKGSEKELRKRLQRKITLTKYKLHLNTVIHCKLCSVEKRYHGSDREPYIACDPSAAESDPLVLLSGGVVKPDESGKLSCEKCGPEFPQVVCNRGYTAFTETKLEEDENVRTLMDQNASTTEILQAKLKDLENRKACIDMEHKKITHASAQFAIFLQQNSMSTYNDATERYLNQLIAFEKEKGTNVTEKQQRYQKMLNEYREEKEIIENSLKTAKSMARPDRKISPALVEQLANELQQLPLYGEDIYTALHTADLCAEFEAQQEKRYTPPKKRGYIERGVQFLKTLRFLPK